MHAPERGRIWRLPKLNAQLICALCYRGCSLPSKRLESTSVEEARSTRLTRCVRKFGPTKGASMSKPILTDHLTKNPGNPRAVAGVLLRGASGTSGELEVVAGARRLRVLLEEYGVAEVELMDSGDRVLVHLVNGQIAVLRSKN